MSVLEAGLTAGTLESSITLAFAFATSASSAPSRRSDPHQQGVLEATDLDAFLSVTSAIQHMTHTGAVDPAP